MYGQSVNYLRHEPDVLSPLPENPRVTVIMVCKDRAWCIEECARSVLPIRFESSGSRIVLYQPNLL